MTQASTAGRKSRPAGARAVDSIHAALCAKSCESARSLDASLRLPSEHWSADRESP